MIPMRFDNSRGRIPDSRLCLSTESIWDWRVRPEPQR